MVVEVMGGAGGGGGWLGKWAGTAEKTVRKFATIEGRTRQVDRRRGFG